MEIPILPTADPTQPPGTTNISSTNPISFPPLATSLESSPTTATIDPLNAARRKHEERAKRFGVEFVEPKLDVVKIDAPKRYRNTRDSGFVTGFSLDDEGEKRKRELRAIKFGSQEPGASTTTTTEPTIEEEDDGGMGMEVDLREERKDVAFNVQRRLDTVYLYGTDEMSTDEVFSYFKDYGAAFVEWINDSSCNVIFRDVHTAMRALQGMSKPMDEFNAQILKPHPSDPPPSSSDPTTVPAPTPAASTSTDTPQPPEVTPPAHLTEPSTQQETVQATPEQIALYGWRKGKSVKGVPILMRYATIEDVKSRQRKPSAYYKKCWRKSAHKKCKSRSASRTRTNRGATTEREGGEEKVNEGEEGRQGAESVRAGRGRSGTMETWKWWTRKNKKKDYSGGDAFSQRGRKQDKEITSFLPTPSRRF